MHLETSEFVTHHKAPRLKSEIEALDHGLELGIGDPQIPFGIGDTVVVQLVHDERQVYPAQASMIAPGLPQAVGAEITQQPHFVADRSLEHLIISEEKRQVPIYRHFLGPSEHNMYYVYF